MAKILIIILLTLSSVQAEKVVRKVVFTGEKPSSKINLANKPGQLFQPDSIASDSAKISLYYQELGWFDCQVWHSYNIKSKGVEIKYRIDKQNRYSMSINCTEMTGSEIFTRQIDSHIMLYDGKPAATSNIEQLADDIIAIYADNGYPYCELRVTDLNKIRESAQIELSLKINPGPKVTVEKFEFAGRKNLNYEFLLTYTTLNPPLSYSAKTFKQIQRRLSLAQFIKDAGDYQLRYSKSPESGVLIFPIEETSPLIIDGALGYSSKDDNLYGQFSAMVTNILGVGRKVEFDWSKKDKSSSRVRVGFSEPYPFGVPFRLDLEAYQDDRDSLFIESGGEIGLYYISSDIYIYGFSVGASKVNPEFYGSSFLPVKNKKKLSLSFTADTRDYPLNPTKGDYFYMKGIFILENTRGDSNFAAAAKNYRTIEFRLEKYFRLTNTSVLYGGLFGQGDFSQDFSSDSQIPADRHFTLGGHGSLRGYSQDFFYISRVGVATVEYRLLTSKNGRAYIFSDMAVFQTPVSGDTPNASVNETWYKAGFGVGLAASVRGGLATIEIAIPHDEGMSSAKLHFGIRAGF